MTPLRPVAYFHQRDLDQHPEPYPDGMPVVTVAQAEAYATKRVNEVIEKAKVETPMAGLVSLRMYFTVGKFLFIALILGTLILLALHHFYGTDVLTYTLFISSLLGMLCLLGMVMQEEYEERFIERVEAALSINLTEIPKKESEHMIRFNPVLNKEEVMTLASQTGFICDNHVQLIGFIERVEQALLAKQDGVKLKPVEGDLLPPIGSKVLIHLSRQDAWVEHTVTGYYVWADLAGDTRLQRVNVQLVDSAGYPNARLLKDIKTLDGQNIVKRRNLTSPNNLNLAKVLKHAAMTLELFDGTTVDNDDYMLTASDCAEILVELVEYYESQQIGAGNVNGKALVCKPIEQHRVEFESAMRSLGIKDVHDFTIFPDGQYVNSFIRERWLIWAHARDIAM